jgi:hypothetical protein
MPLACMLNKKAFILVNGNQNSVAGKVDKGGWQSKPNSKPVPA